MLLNVVLCNQVKASYLLVSMFHLINFMSLDGILNFFLDKIKKNGSNHFNSTKIVSIFLTILVLFNVVLCNQVKASYLLVSMFYLINFMSLDGILNFFR